MALRINDDALERSLKQLARRQQPLPATKHGMAYAILRKALQGGIGHAHRWLHDGDENARCGASDPGG